MGDGEARTTDTPSSSPPGSDPEKASLEIPQACIAEPTADNKDANIVDFDGPDDKYNPINWTFSKKVYTSTLYSLTSLGSVWASTAYAPANTKIAEQFDVSHEVALIGTSLLLLGWGFGPLLWAPLSELYGRKWPVLIPFLISTVMSFGTAAAKDIQTVLITRFFTGFFGSAPITCTGGVFVDLWEATQRGNAIVGYTFCVCGGPALAPVVGGAIIICGASWRWTEYVTGLLQSVVLLLDILFISESYPPILLTRRASLLRKSTNNWALHSLWEANPSTIHSLVVKFGLRPLQMLVTPICLFITIYSSFIYAVFYASLASFPVIFQETRGWNNLTGNLPFLAVLVGIIFGAALNWWNQRYYIERFVANDNKPVPEARLPPMMIASVVLVAGLFLIGWTASPSTPWQPTVAGVFLLGFGYYTIFTSALNYLIDTFPRWSASALAANTFARSVLAAVLPLLIPAMYGKLGNAWSATVLGGFAVLNIPIPFVFWWFGARIRGKGRWSADVEGSG